MSQTTPIDRETASKLNPLIEIFTEDTLSQCSRMVQSIGYLLSQIDSQSEEAELYFGNLYLLCNPISAALNYEIKNPCFTKKGESL